MDIATPSAAAAGRALVPELWSCIDEVVCGFGDRDATAPAGTLLVSRQVHGTAVVDAADPSLGLRRDDPDGYPRLVVEADAIVAARPGVVAGVRTADCVPLLLVAPRRGWAAAVHAGWRGTLSGIAVAAVQAAGHAGIRSEELLAALGPSIGPCCYEVSPELGRDFAAAGLPVRTAARGGRPHLDLREANRTLLVRSGVPESGIQTVGPCTRCAQDRYHSFRAEPGSGGRQISWIGWADRTR